jgi:hypothetical protein
MQQICREKNKHTKIINTSVWMLCTGTVYSVTVSTSVDVVHRYSLRCNSQHQRKQAVRNQHRENKSETNGPKCATNNVIKKGTLSGPNTATNPTVC